jgi:hypothetical protein
MTARVCAQCRSFKGGAASFEAALPGVASLSSAHAALRAGDGHCTLHDRLVAATSCCPALEPAI